MNKFIRELLSEKSTISTMRVMAISSLICGLFIAWYGAITGKDVTALVSLLTISSFGGKVAQKVVE